MSRAHAASGLPDGQRRCPALLIAAPASGQGKTTVTAGLARLLTREGWRVRVFKCGPDFLDPQWHALASGRAVHNLDLWLNGESDLRARLHEAANESDLILIEGVMGLFDGNPDAASLAMLLGIPVLAVIDASAMAGTFGALAHGLRTWRPGLPWAGVLANRVASEGHEAMLQGVVEPDVWLGALRRDPGLSLPERHLGLIRAIDLPDAVVRLDAMADALAGTPLGQRTADGWAEWSVHFPAVPVKPIPRLLAGRTVAVARDAAFCFCYPANLDALQALGATVCFFAPLDDEPPPPCDAIWLPGGYPELFGGVLAEAAQCRAALAEHLLADRPVWAECGGMMPLFERMELADGTGFTMWGLLPGVVRMNSRLAGLGPQQWSTTAGTLRGHTYHWSVVDTPLEPVTRTAPPRQTPGRSGVARPAGQGEAVYRRGALQASYFHPWFPSSPQATAALFGAPGLPGVTR